MDLSFSMPTEDQSEHMDGENMGTRIFFFQTNSIFAHCYALEVPEVDWFLKTLERDFTELDHSLKYLGFLCILLFCPSLH